MQFGFTNHQKGTIKQSACSTPKAMKSTTEEVTKRSLRCLILNKLIFLKKCKWLRIRHSKMQNAPTLNHKDAHSISRQSAPSIIHRNGSTQRRGHRFQKSDKKQNDKKHTKTQPVTPSTATSAPPVQNQKQYTKTQRVIPSTVKGAEQTTLRGAATETQKLDKLLALKLHSKKARIQTPGKSKKRETMQCHK